MILLTHRDESSCRDFRYAHFFGSTTLGDNDSALSLINLKSPQLFSSDNLFVIDTGASISIIKQNALHPSAEKIVTNFKILKGIECGNDPPVSQGSCYIYIEIGKYQFLKHQFLVVSDNFGCKYDGLLGNDFIKSHKCEIKSKECVITMGDYKLPFFDTVVKNVKPKIDAKRNSTSIVPPYSERVIFVKVTNTSLKEGVAIRSELMPGVFTPECFVSVNDDGYALITVLNTTDKEVTLTNVMAGLVPIDNCIDRSKSTNTNIHFISSQNNGTEPQRIHPYSTSGTY